MGLADDRKPVNLMTVHVSKSVTAHEVSNIYFKVLFFLLLYWLNIVVIIVLTTAEPNKMLIPEVSSPITSFSSRLSVLVLFHL